MELWIILVIVLLVIGLVIFLRVFRSIIAVALSVLGLLIILVIAAGIVLYVDVSNMKNAFEGDKLFVLTKDSVVRAGLVVDDVESIVPGSINYLDGSEVVGINSFFEEKKYGDMRGDNDLMIIFSYKAFNGTQGLELEDIGISIGYDEIGLILEEDSLESAFMVMLGDEGLTGEEAELVLGELADEFGSIEELKAVLLMFLFGDRVKEEGLLFIVDNYKEENLVVSPGFISIRLLELLPGSVKERILGGAI